MDPQVCRALKRITLGSKFGVAFDPILNHEMPQFMPNTPERRSYYQQLRRSPWGSRSHVVAGWEFGDLLRNW